MFSLPKVDAGWKKWRISFEEDRPPLRGWK